MRGNAQSTKTTMSQVLVQKEITARMEDFIKGENVGFSTIQSGGDNMTLTMKKGIEGRPNTFGLQDRYGNLAMFEEGLDAMEMRVAVPYYNTVPVLETDIEAYKKVINIMEEGRRKFIANGKSKSVNKTIRIYDETVTINTYSAPGLDGISTTIGILDNLLKLSIRVNSEFLNYNLIIAFINTLGRVSTQQCILAV